MVWFACAALVVLAGFFVLMPLFREPKNKLGTAFAAETELDRLLNRKAVVYANLKDLELEYKMGRLSDADFRQLGTGYKNEASAILYRIDQMRASEGPDKTMVKDIASRKSKPNDPGTGRGRDSSRCPSCGAEAVPGKKFCADCGHRF